MCVIFYAILLLVGMRAYLLCSRSNRPHCRSCLQASCWKTESCKKTKIGVNVFWAGSSDVPIFCSQNQRSI